MNIQWNKVTWYSKLLAVVLFVLTFWIGFNLGKEKEAIDLSNEVFQKQNSVNENKISINAKDIKEENFTGTMPVISGSGLLIGEAKNYIEQTIVDFRKQANADVPEMRKQFGADSPTAKYEIDIEAKYIKSEKTESIAMSVYTYTGGANGNTNYKVITTSLFGGGILSLTDILKKDKQIAFTEFVKKELIDWRPDISDGLPVVFVDDIKNLKFDSFKNWSIDNEKLIIYFDKYEIGPGALGAVAFPLSLSKIKNFLK